MPVIFRQLFDTASSTYTYLLGDSHSHGAIIIDPVFEQQEREIALLRELGLTLHYTVETHCHADHITGAWVLRQLTGSKIAASESSGIQGLDRALKDGDILETGEIRLAVRATPGHTSGCITLVLSDRTLAFTGDCLLIRGCGRTDFQQGSAATLYHSIIDKIFSLPDNCLIYPGHDYQGRMQSSVGEEKRFNPRVGGGASETDFVGYMDNMALPHPKKLAEAVPANLVAGKTRDGSISPSPDWAPVITTYSGIREVSCQWVASQLGKVVVLDVREPLELNEEPFSCEGYLNIPLADLDKRLSEIPKDRPVFTLCHSGKRSAMAYLKLQEQGWEQVANIHGGLLCWCAEGLLKRSI